MRLLVATTLAAALAYAAPAAAQPATQADEEAAKAHFLAGEAYYQQANYGDAVKEFNEAHRLSKRADLLYNISVCYERLGRWDDAIGALQQYLTEKPDAPDRVVIESRIANFQQRRDAALAAPPPVKPPPPVPPPPRRRHVTSIIVGSVGAGVLLGALGTGVTAQLTYNDLNNKCPNMTCNGHDQTLRDEQNLGKALAISTDVLLALGGATLITGVILFILEARRPAVRAQLSPSAQGLLVRF
jgi:tetratricopeptide (TPR) repeat protein